MNLETKLKQYEIGLGDLGVMPYQDNDRILVQVNTNGLTDAEASAKVLEVQEQVEGEFPGAKVIAHPHTIQYFIMPKHITDPNIGGKIIAVETLRD